MKKKEIFYILLGVTIGNALSLFMTLYLWGSAWWQVAIAIIAGTFVGAMITDFKLFKQFALESHQESIVWAENVFSINLWQKINWKRILYFIHNVFLTLLIIALFIGFYHILSIAIEQLSPLDLLLLTILGLILWFYTIISLINYPIRESTLKKTFEDYRYLDLDKKKVHQYKSEILLEALNSLPFHMFLKKLWHAKWLDFAWMWKDILNVVLFIVFGLILTLVAWLPLILFISLKNILKYNQFLLVFFGVAIGTITGVLTVNIVFGLITGIIPVFLAVLFNVIVSEFKYNDAKRVFKLIENLI